jgi:diguanylate cyclase (GGDEF)-like protein
MVARFSAFRASLEKRSDEGITAIVGYVLLAASTIHFTSNGRNHATMWPADALILAMLIKNPRRHWPAILLAGWAGNLFANIATRGWVPGLVCYGAINMGQTALAAWLIGRDDDPAARAGTTVTGRRGAAGFALYAGIVAPLCGALLGSLVTAFNYGEPIGPSFVRWYLSNALGLLIFTPFLHALLKGSYVRWFRTAGTALRLEAAGLYAGHFAVTLVVFAQTPLPLLYLPVSSVLVLSFRLGRLGTILGVMVIAVIGAVATYAGLGPMALVKSGVDMQELLFQFYLAVVLATALPVAEAITARAQMLELLAERAEALRLMTLHAPEGILGFDTTGTCRRAEGPLLDYLGIEPGAMIGRSLDAVALRASDLAATLAARRAGDEPPPCASFEFTPLLRPLLTLEASVGVLWRGGVAGGTPIGTVVTLRDVTPPRTRELPEQAMLPAPLQVDDLTGLANRPGFHRHLRAAIVDGGAVVTLALVEVNGFREINERHGHAAGDAVLVELARRLKIATRSEDVVARLGGAEFAILLRCDLATAQRVCQRMVDAVRDGPILRDGTVSILTSVSCGIAEHRPGAPRDEVFDAADAALHEAKRSGRNAVQAAA